MRRPITIISIVFVSALFHTLYAQTVSSDVRLVQDDIPARFWWWSTKAELPLSPTFSLELRQLSLFARQEEFNGLARLEKRLHTVQAGTRIALPKFGLGIHLLGGVNTGHGNPTLGEFRGHLQWTQNVGSLAQPLLRIRIDLESVRQRETSVLTAVEEQILFSESTSQLGVEVLDRISVVGYYGRRFYSDANNKTSAYGYMLAQVVKDPDVRLGYAYAYTNSLSDNWQLVNTKLVSFDPVRRIFLYEYSYFYYPYFTPIKEQGHILIGVVQWSPVDRVLLYAKASIPVSSKGLLKYMPNSGNVPRPIDYNVYYTTTDILPTQIDASLLVTVSRAVLVRLDFEHFQKPYYKYHVLGLGASYIF